MATRKRIEEKKRQLHQENKEKKVSTPEYDLKTVLAWAAPKEDGAPIIAMPNIPKPIHGLAPRTVLGDSTWQHMRKRCYFEAGYKSQISGIDLDRSSAQLRPNAHELYSYNYYTGEALFERAVCISPLEHNFIHSGRMLTMYKKGNPLMPKSYLLAAVENGFRIIKEWNDAHPKERPLRVYYTFIEYAKTPSIANEIQELIEKYDIKFYRESFDTPSKWSDWHLKIGNRIYKTPYADINEWEKVMGANDLTNQNAAVDNILSSDLDQEIENILNAD